MVELLGALGESDEETMAKSDRLGEHGLYISMYIGTHPESKEMNWSYKSSSLASCH
jgi:hypothetical protein